MNDATFAVNQETCIACGLCASDCVCEIIKMADFPYIQAKDLKKCIHCGHCQAICPTASITLDNINPASLADTQKPLSIAKLENLIRSRRSTRHFSYQPIEHETLEQVIELAAWAPTAKNIRDLGYVICNGREKMTDLMNATATIMEKHNFLVEVSSAIREERDVLFRQAPCLLIIHAPDRPFSCTDCATALATIELSLPSFGLASSWAGYFTAACSQEIPAGISIPAGHHIYGALMIGKPTVAYKRITHRVKANIDWI